ncbi:glycosyltransferase family 87 protein [Hymenobacter lapidarius]|uniref:glycosyltransferase family 87 protein n=1 Tax=Hymenobacter lapidarius TaxID=1908237 RepID=UPI000B09293F|nr:glycosyltransferase family 87 protein [Hymenobacter lapidarius]
MPRPVLLLLVLIALFNVSRVLREPGLTGDRPMDFRTCYVGQAVLRQGQNPYDDATLKRGWQRIVAAEQLVSRTEPGLPNLPFLYPPWAVALFGLTVGQLAYALAWPLWGALAMVCLLAAARWWPALSESNEELIIPWWHFLVFAFALKGTVPALLTGQPTFLALALGVGALAVAQLNGSHARPSPSTLPVGLQAASQSRPAAADRSWRPVVAGALLGLAAFKVTLLLPFAAWFIWKKQWRSLVVATVVVALLSAVAWQWAAAPAELLPTYRHLLAQVRAQSFDPADPDYPLTQGMTLRLELGNVLEWLRPGSSAWHVVLHSLLWLGAGLRMAWLHRQGKQVVGWWLFLVISTLTLLTTYHLYYDAVLLLPLLAFAARLPGWPRLLLLVLLLPLLLPLNGLAQALGNPVALQWVYFLMPLSLLGVLGLLLAWPVSRAGRQNDLRTSRHDFFV